MVSKAAYVLRQGQSRAHTCHWPGCPEQVPPAMWGCRRHWFKIPKELRHRIWESYRPGQENDLRPSEAYVQAAKAVQEWVRSALADKAAAQRSLEDL